MSSGAPGELTEVLRSEREVSGYEHDLLTQALTDHPIPYAEDIDHPENRPRRGTRHR